MRGALMALVLLIGGSAAALALPGRPYAVYVFDPVEGPDVFVFAGPNGAAAFEESACGQYALRRDAQALLEQLRRRRHGENVSLIHIDGGNSRTEMGWWCDGEDDDEAFEDEDDPPQDSLVVIDDLNARQVRRLLNGLTPVIRENVETTLGLTRAAR